MKRRCPNCGAVVPDNSLTCPQCFAEVDRVLSDDPKKSTREQFREHIQRRDKNMTVSLVLAILPAFIGLLGLGLIYQDFRDIRGYRYLGTGFVLFMIPVCLIVFLGLFSLILIIPIFFMLLLYLVTALASIAETHFGSIDLNFRRM